MPTRQKLIRCLLLLFSRSGKEVNYYNKSLPLTQEFLKVHNTVPAGKAADGTLLRESLPMVYRIDERVALNPLQPGTEEKKAEMKALIKKYTEGEFSVVTLLYKYLKTPSSDPAAENVRASLLRNYAELSRDLAKNGGPYLLGPQFTVADIALIPFIDRAIVLLGHYRNFEIPQDDTYGSFWEWVAEYRQRPSHSISDADRLPRSMETQPFENKERDPYLIEMYEMYAEDVKDEVRAQLASAPPGRRSVDIQAAKAQKEKTERAKQEKEARRPMEIGAAIVALTIGIGVAAFVAARKGWRPFGRA
jgi:glutathione S-transferase